MAVVTRLASATLALLAVLAVIVAALALAFAAAKAEAATGVERTAAVASHYGPPDEPAGQPVACGSGRMPAGVHGVAHRTLPCGTRIGTCLPDLSACIEARVTDRGPFVPGRELDFHGKTFSALAPLSVGVLHVVYRVHRVARCVPKWVHTYWRPAQGYGGAYAPTCGTRYVGG